MDEQGGLPNAIIHAQMRIPDKRSPRKAPAENIDYRLSLAPAKAQ